jgi:Fic family protein
MFAPNYKLTPELLKNMYEVERLYGQLEARQTPKSLLLNLERDNLVQSSYSSNRIEGNPLSHADVTNLLLDERIPVNRDEKEVANYFDILKSLSDLIDKPITVEVLLHLHSQLLTGVQDNIKGKLRNTSVVVGRKNELGEVFIKHNPPAHDQAEIEKLLQELSHWIDAAQELPILKAGIFHHHFVYIHPFEDGNGRVCRLATALIFLKHSYQINKYFVLDDYYDVDRDLYSDKLHAADSGDKTEWLEYFTEGVKYSLQSALAKIDKGMKSLSFDLRPTQKEAQALKILQENKEMSSGDLAKEIKVTRQQAFNLLKSLVEKGFVEQVGEKRGAYYKVKR